VICEPLARNAAALILVHNHPSGVAEPSPADESDAERKAASTLVDMRVLDHLIVAGNVDVIEIKKPMVKSIMLPALYRDHHLPMRDLIGAMGHGYALSEAPEPMGAHWRELSDPVARPQLPAGFRIRIINPSGIVIMGRSNTLFDAQRREFEVLRRDSKGVVDIVTYDDLLARLQAVVDQLRGGPAVSAAYASSPTE